MTAHRLPHLLGCAVIAASGVGLSVAESATAIAAAGPCPDIQVVFARGTDDPPGVGPAGQAFIDALRPRLGAAALDVYPVDYPASYDFTNSGKDGIRDAGAHIVSMAQDCPTTKMVLGGYSAGAAVMGFVTTAEVPAGIDPATVPKPLDPQIAKHVSSVVLFALPSEKMLNMLGEPPVVINPLYQPKTLTVCADQDPICSDGGSFDVHKSYATNAPVIDRGAAFAAARLSGVAGAQAAAASVSVDGAIGG